MSRRRSTKDESEMIERILAGARKGGKTTQSQRTPEEKSRIGHKGGMVVREAFKSFKH